MTKAIPVSALPVTEDDLQAYVDGFLDPPRHTTVDAYLAANPDEAERIEAYRSQRISMHALFGIGSDRPLPEPLAARVDQLASALRQRRWLRTSLWAAASIAVVGFLAAAGWWVYEVDGYRGDRLIAFVDDWNARTLLAGHELGRQHQATMGKKKTGEENGLVVWLTRNATAASVPIPNLQSFGYNFLEGRMLATPSGPVLQLTYTDAESKTVKLYVGTDTGTDTSDLNFAQEADAPLVYWTDGSLVYALTGMTQRDSLARIAQAIGSSIAEPAGSTAPAARPGTGTTANKYTYSLHDTGATNQRPDGAKISDVPAGRGDPDSVAPSPVPAADPPQASPKVGAGPEVSKKPSETST